MYDSVLSEDARPRPVAQGSRSHRDGVLHPNGFSGEGCVHGRRYSKIGVNVAVPLWLTGAAGVGIALGAPIFVAVTLLFALVAYLGAALEAWTRRRPVNTQYTMRRT